MNTEKQPMTNTAFQNFGDGQLAYVRQIKSDDVPNLFPGAPEMAPGLKLWALLNADGSPILLTDSRAAAEVNASNNELTMMSVH